MARKRRAAAFRPGTAVNHKAMFKKYIEFCLKHKCRYVNPTVRTLCAYIEYLAQSFISFKSVSNYVSGVKLLHKYMDKSIPNMQSFEVSLMLRSCALTMRHVPNRRPPVTVQMLRKLCKMCEKLGNKGLVIRVALLLSFYGFLRASNVCPTSSRGFDATRNFTRQDVHVAPPGLQLRIKWTKTLQKASQPRIIPIPSAQEYTLDAVRAYKEMIHRIPAHPSQPLLMLHNNKPLVISQLRKAFKLLLRAAGYSDSFTLHCLRKGGATTSYHAGASYLDIQRQGTWSSSVFWTYITSSAPKDSTVTSALQNAVNQG